MDQPFEAFPQPLASFSSTVFPYAEGDDFRARYTDAPIDPSRQYPIGAQVAIHNEHGTLLATYEVEGSDDTYNWGKIAHVFDAAEAETP